jgi:hypothetical protein
MSILQCHNSATRERHLGLIVAVLTIYFGSVKISFANYNNDPWSSPALEK